MSMSRRESHWTLRQTLVCDRRLLTTYPGYILHDSYKVKTQSLSKLTLSSRKSAIYHLRICCNLHNALTRAPIYSREDMRIFGTKKCMCLAWASNEILPCTNEVGFPFVTFAPVECLPFLPLRHLLILNQSSKLEMSSSLPKTASRTAIMAAELFTIFPSPDLTRVSYGRLTPPVAVRCKWCNERETLPYYPDSISCSSSWDCPLIQGWTEHPG